MVCEGGLCETDNTRSFFFSSRRRHTRFDCDWSSDVCSSDLRTEKHRHDLHHPRQRSLRTHQGASLTNAPTRDADQITTYAQHQYKRQPNTTRARIGLHIHRPLLRLQHETSQRDGKESGRPRGLRTSRHTPTLSHLQRYQHEGMVWRGKTDRTHYRKNKTPPTPTGGDRD